MKKSFKLKVRNWIGIGLTVLFGIGIFAGCTPKSPTTPSNQSGGLVYPAGEALTEEEIREMIQKKYFNEDGTVKLEYWEKYAGEDAFNAFWQPDCIPEQITGFEVSIINSWQSEQPQYYLAEFEPCGHVFGYIQGTGRTEFAPCPSAFKTLNIPEDNRYYEHNSGETTKINGKFVELSGILRKRYGRVDIEESAYVAVFPAGDKVNGYLQRKAVDWSRPWITEEGFDPLNEAIAEALKAIYE